LTNCRVTRFRRYSSDTVPTNDAKYTVRVSAEYPMALGLLLDTEISPVVPVLNSTVELHSLPLNVTSVTSPPVWVARRWLSPMIVRLLQPSGSYEATVVVVVVVAVVAVVVVVVAVVDVVVVAVVVDGVVVVVVVVVVAADVVVVVAVVVVVVAADVVDVVVVEVEAVVVDVIVVGNVVVGADVMGADVMGAVVLARQH
jgi:hypothetical protein